MREMQKKEENMSKKFKEARCKSALEADNIVIPNNIDI